MTGGDRLCCQPGLISVTNTEPNRAAPPDVAARGVTFSGAISGPKAVPLVANARRKR